MKLLNKPWFPWAFFSGLLIFMLLFSASHACAQTAEDLQKQIDALQAQVNALKAKPAVVAQAPVETPKVESGFGKIKFDGLIQTWYTAGGQNVIDTFKLRRGELKFSGTINPKANWVVLLDVAKGLSLTTKTDSKTGDISSVSPNQASRILQDAYINLNYVPKVTISVGQMKVPLGLEAQTSAAKLDTVERALFTTDKARGAGFGDTHDMGIMVSGFVTKYLEYQGGVFNGSGEYQNTTSGWDQKTTIGRAVVHPYTGLQFGASVARGYGIDNSTLRPTRNRFGAEAQYLRGPLTVRSEFAQLDDGAIVREGYYGHVGYKVSKHFEPIVRFDAFAPDVAHEGVKATALERDYVSGFNYYFTQQYLKLQLDYARKTFANNPALAQNMFMTNLQVSW